jgi:hypothetical protein
MSDETDAYLLRTLDERIRGIALEVYVEQSRRRETAEAACVTAEAEKLRGRLQRIMAKEFISIAEAALLLNCSDGHLRNLIGKALKGKSADPIPFLDLDGVKVIPRARLLEWAAQPKRMCGSPAEG